MKTATAQKQSGTPKTFKGVVVSSKMKDTIVVSVTRFVKHPRYKKYIARRKRYHVHDAGNTKVVGQTVTIVETKPISKTKSFKVV